MVTTVANMVSVVIPSVLRPEVARAISSARSQKLEQGVDIEVVLCVDMHEMQITPAQRRLVSGADTVVFTGGKRGAAAARNIGVGAASGRWVAFLDDDDQWSPFKLQEQLRCFASGEDMNRIVSCRAEQQLQIESKTLKFVVPSKVKPPSQSVPEYLFRRRTAHLGRNSLHTSTLLVDRELALRVPWDETLPRHQDWDWLMRAERGVGAEIVQIEDVLVEIATNSKGSISASSDWRSSVMWARAWKSEMSKAAYVDFLVGQALRYALQARSWVGVRAVLTEVFGARRVPYMGSVVLGLGGLASRDWSYRFVSSLRRGVSRRG